MAAEINDDARDGAMVARRRRSGWVAWVIIVFFAMVWVAYLNSDEYGSSDAQEQAAQVARDAEQERFSQRLDELQTQLSEPSAPDSTPGRTSTSPPTERAGSGGGSSSGRAAEGGFGSTGDSSQEADMRSRIYRDSSQWRWLERPSTVQPGVKMVNDQGGFCSVGFIVGSGQRNFILTAGHCGDTGTQWGIETNRGVVPIGTMVESEFTRVGGPDYGLIELNPNVPVSAAPPFEQELVGWKSGEWLERTSPTVCRLGWRSGLSCGEFIESDGVIIRYENISDQGDSGGPIFAIDDSGLHAVGLTSGGQADDATNAIGVDIAPPMEHWGLTIFNR